MCDNLTERLNIKLYEINVINNKTIDKIIKTMIKYLLDFENWYLDNEDDIMKCEFEIRCTCPEIYQYHQTECEFRCALKMKDKLEQKINEIFDSQYTVTNYIEGNGYSKRHSDDFSFILSFKPNKN